MPTMMLPDAVAKDLSSLSEEEMKRRIITQNGFTIAQEDEILRIAREDEVVGPMTPEEFMAEMQSMIDQHRDA